MLIAPAMAVLLGWLLGCDWVESMTGLEGVLARLGSPESVADPKVFGVTHEMGAERSLEP